MRSATAASSTPIHSSELVGMSEAMASSSASMMSCIGPFFFSDRSSESASAKL